MKRQPFSAVLLASALTLLQSAYAAQEQSRITVDHEQVRAWNQFADHLYRLHVEIIKQHRIKTTEQLGGYARLPNFYREVSYFDAADGRLLSRIAWERAQPKNVHVIEVFIYDPSGRVTRDYLAAYLPRHRNAPIQTLINFHNYDGELHAFRQFDASGNRIYEQCRGRHFGEPVEISLEETEIVPILGAPSPVTRTENYTACFSGLSAQAGKYLDPLAELRQSHQYSAQADSADTIEASIARYNREIFANPDDASLYLARADAFLQLHEFDRAIDDYTRAIERDDRLDEAYYGRGMARGRSGLIEQGIADLSIYIQRHPTSSVAYTKRGVRHIWNRDLVSAERDLKRAIALQPNNAEAHDDLGVIYAQRGQTATAIEHFRTTIRIDPSYHKGYHNLATAYMISGNATAALAAVDEALRLDPESRNSLLLKGEVLKSLGRNEEAQAIIEHAEFLPEGNWSERWSVENNRR